MAFRKTPEQKAADQAARAREQKEAADDRARQEYLSSPAGQAAQAKEPGLYQWNPQVGHVVSLANRAEVLKALRVVYRDCPWVDLNRLFLEMQDPDTTESDNRRFYLNEVWAGSDSAWPAKQIEALVAAGA